MCHIHRLTLVVIDTHILRCLCYHTVNDDDLFSLLDGAGDVAEGIVAFLQQFFYLKVAVLFTLFGRESKCKQSFKCR